MICEQCRQQMLPYLYDLLDDQARQAVAAHLDICSECRDALQLARQQQGMLAEAVKQEHADFVFKAPSKATPASTAPTLVLPRPPRRSFLLTRWAAAAAILFFLFSAGSVIGYTTWRGHSETLDAKNARLAKAKGDLKNSQDNLNQQKEQTQEEIRRIQKQIDSLFTDWKSEENKTRKVLKGEQVKLFIKGPQVAQAGVNNRYEVEMVQKKVAMKGDQKGVKDSQTMPQLQVNLVNQKNKEVLHSQQLNMQQNASANFDVPANVPIKPNDDLALEFQTKDAEGKVVVLRDNLRVVFPDYVTHLTTDRPMYRPGDTVRFRSLTLERFSLKPAQQDFHLRFRIVGPRNVEIFSTERANKIVNDQNEEIKGPDRAPLRSLGAGEFKLPAELPEGQYALYVNEVNERFNEEKRSFLVRTWQTPRFNKELQFHRSSYGAGDQVKVTVRVAPVQGANQQAPNNLQVSATAVVDGVTVMAPNQVNLIDGSHTFEFRLPEQITKGIGVVTVKCEDGGHVETMVRSVPIVMRDLAVDFYPEGGDLIAGVPNRVYFQARTPANKPADIEGVILDDNKQEVARIRTITDDAEPGINQGLGVFTFTPRAKMRYALRIDAPIGIERTIVLPEPKNNGVVLTIPQGVVDNDIRVTLRNTKQARELLVGAYCRGRLLDHQVVKAGVNTPTDVVLKPQAGVGGVYRITVFEKTRGPDGFFYRPLAERLIYRKATDRVDVAIESDRKSYQPGDTVRLNLRAVNEKRAFVPTLALVAVVDTSVLKLADEKTQRAMPTHFLLTTEIRSPEDLEYADVLLGNHTKAPLALDLLLGCQGWRRFAEQDPVNFQQKQHQQKNPAFLNNTAVVSQFLDTEQKQLENLDENFVKSAIDLEKKLADTERQEAGPPDAQQNVALMQSNVEQAKAGIDEVQQQLRELRAFFMQFGLGGALLVLLFLGFFLISVGLRRLSEGGEARSWLFAGFALMTLLFLVSIIGTFTLMGEPMMMENWGGKREKAMKNAAPDAFPLARIEEEPMAPVVPEDLIDDEARVAEPKVEMAQKKRGGGPVAQAPRNFGGPEQDLRNFNQFNAPGDGQNFQANVMNLQAFDNDRLLRQQGNYQALIARNLGRRVQLPAVNDACVVREYAHQHRAAKDGVRRDFAETIYWHPALMLPDGNTQVQFDLSDSVTRFQVLVVSNTFDGRLGANTIELTSKLPFTVEPKVPSEVSSNDQITIPVAITNDLAKDTSATLLARFKGLQLLDNAERGVNLQGNKSKRELFHVKPSIKSGVAFVRVVGKTSRSVDAVERKFNVAPDGFPIVGSISGTLDASVEHEITLPETWLPGSLDVRAHFYPSSVAELQSGLDALLQEPAGCFEQSSSNNYPNVLILNYMKQMNQSNPTAEKRARQLLDSGYQRLTSFECQDPKQATLKQGYEWFGGIAAPHEALTAYGLLQFRDMANTYHVDEAMLQRTEKYLLDQRDNKGGFKRNPRGLDQFGRAPDPVTNAYIVWALTESGVRANLDTELAELYKQGKTSKDPYFLALTGLSHLNRQKTEEGVELLQAAAAFQKADGQLTGAATSITGSRGRDLDIETTSLAVLGWLKADRPGDFNRNLRPAVQWLGAQRRGAGSFGGTQATILALKALLAHAQKQPKIQQGGELAMSVRPVAPPDQKVDWSVPQLHTLTARAQDTITLSLSDVTQLQPGKNVIQLGVTGKNSLPYTLTWSYRTQKPANDANTPVKIATKLSSDQAKEGDTVKMFATIENVSGKGQGMTVAILGLPGGLALPEDVQQLKTLSQLQNGGTKPGKISAWELRGRDLVLYWRDLAPDAKIEVELDLICRLPGFYRGPASRAYLYYDADSKFWIEPLSIRIAEAE